MNTFAINIRREFWEHRSLWIAPLIWTGVLTLMFAWLIFVVVPHEIGKDNLMVAPDSHALAQMSEEDRRNVEAALATARGKAREAHDSGEGHEKVFAASHLANTAIIAGFASIVVFFYLIDCLYTERRDRSILFWKSLPISDAQVVLSKLAVALVIVPLGAVLLASVMQLVMLAMVWLRFHGTEIWGLMPDWGIGAWLKSVVLSLLTGLVGVLWYAPIAGYLLLVSSWARRNALLWAILPPVSLMALEGFFFHSGNVARFIGFRLGGFVQQLRVDPSALNMGVHEMREPRVDDVFSSFDLTNVFMHADVWVGLVVAGAMVFVAIRMRRYRDES